jgi:hypothetical protein
MVFTMPRNICRLDGSAGSMVEYVIDYKNNNIDLEEELKEAF